MIYIHQWHTCSRCSSRPYCLLNIWCICCLTPHAYFSSKHKLLLGNIIYSFYRFCSVEFIPRDIQMVKIPNTLIAENASETLCNGLRTNPSTQPKATQQNIFEFTRLDILLHTNVKLLPRGKTHQLCTIVRGLRFAANVLKVSSLFKYVTCFSI